MNSFQVGNLVCYDNQDKILTAVVKATAGIRVELVNNTGGNITLPAERLYPLPLSFRSDQPNNFTNELNAFELQANDTEQKIELPLLWENISEQSLPSEGSDKDNKPKEKNGSENKAFALAELCELFFANKDATSQLAMRQALASNKIFFKREKDYYYPRPIETVLQLLKGQEAAESKAKLQEKALTTIKARISNNQIIIDEDLSDIIHALILVAAGNEVVDPKNLKLIKEIVVQVSEELNLDEKSSLQTKVYKILIAAKIISEHDHLSFIRNGVHTFFPEACISEAKALLTKNQFNQSEYLDLTNLESFTIDDESTNDMDDAFSLEETASGYRLGIHITDVAAVISENGNVDQEASSRATSIYCPETKINMIPQELSENLLSLKVGEVRRCISLLIELDQNLSATASNIKLCSIKSVKKYSYNEVDQILLDDSSKNLRILNTIANSRLKMRMDNGAKQLPKRALTIHVDRNHTVTLSELNEGTTSHNLVAEMMIWANEEFARFCSVNNLPVLYRSQKEPRTDHSLTETLATLSPDNVAYQYLIRSNFSPSYQASKAERHSSLGLEYYLQATSPIRRYLDLMVQRQIRSFILKNSPHYAQKDFKSLASELEPRLSAAQLATRQAERFWILWFVKQNLNKQTVSATVLRNEKKYALIELSNPMLTCFCQIPKELKPGSLINVRIKRVQPQYEEIILEYLPS